jgi:hypothetical protein
MPLKFHQVKITNTDKTGLPMGTVVELDGKNLSFVKEVAFHQSNEEFTTVSIKIIGKMEFISDGCALILILHDDRKFRVLEEV